MANVTLAKLIEDWLAHELFDDFSIVYPRDGDTIMVGYEASIKYDHHSEGYATIVSIFGDYIYVDYEGTVVEASSPDFFEKLKNIILHHKAIHANCKHVRAVND